jgi:hypothetical protein
MFERVYDRHPRQRYRVQRRGDWWAIDVGENADRVLVPRRRSEAARDEKVIALCHDVERDWGHRDSDPELVSSMRAAAPAHLEAMLRLEREAGVRATYNVVGAYLPEVRQRIEADGHAVAFHSFDHRLPRDRLDGPRRLLAQALIRIGRRSPRLVGNQLGRCRAVDYRLRGYRPPQSRLTAELTHEHLCFHNFEWLALSIHGLRTPQPRMRRRLAEIPILFDDYALFRAAQPYEAWERWALAAIEQAPFAAFSLHDCYGDRWLPHYARLLEGIQRLGTLKTLDEVANEVILRSAWEGPSGPMG